MWERACTTTQKPNLNVSLVCVGDTRARVEEIGRKGLGHSVPPDSFAFKPSSLVEPSLSLHLVSFEDI